MPHVMLHKNWPGGFKRTVCRGTPQERQIVFQAAGEVQDIPKHEIESIVHDLGKALIPVEYSPEKLKFVPIDMGEVDLQSTVVPRLADQGEGEHADTTDNSVEFKLVETPSAED